MADNILFYIQTNYALNFKYYDKNSTDFLSRTASFFYGTVKKTVTISIPSSILRHLCCTPGLEKEKNAKMTMHLLIPAWLRKGNFLTASNTVRGQFTTMLSQVHIQDGGCQKYFPSLNILEMYGNVKKDLTPG